MERRKKMKKNMIKTFVMNIPFSRMNGFFLALTTVSGGSPLLQRNASHFRKEAPLDSFTIDFLLEILNNVVMYSFCLLASVELDS